jgi:hypothetical protein
MMIDTPEMSRHVDRVEQNRSINAIYGHIINTLDIDEQQYYIALVALEETSFDIDLQCSYIPLEESHEQLSANYGSPRDLIGLRVRVEYYGSSWKTGVAHIVPERNRQPVGNTTEIPARGFRFAVAGGGSI